jgi:hypothetical protein
MTLWRDFESEMQRLPLDIETADRLLAGSVPAEDAPPGYARVATLLRSAAESVGPDSPEDGKTLMMLLAAVRTSQRKSTPPARRSSVYRWKLASALATTALACTTGLAFAGSLPGTAQNIASSMLDKAGISVPGPNESAGTHPDIRGSSTTEGATPESTSDTELTSGKGSEISQLATTTELTGIDKGAAISTLASGGQSRAGQSGQAGAEHGAASETSTSGGADTAAAASDGHSSAGAGNAATGRSHQP